MNIDNGRRSGVQNLTLPITEIILHICTWSLITEEIRQVKRPIRFSGSFKREVVFQFLFTGSKRDYFAEIWNIIDIAAILLYLVGFITRFFVLQSLFTVSK